MSNKNTSISTSAIKVLRVLDVLKGHTIGGLSNGDIAKQLSMPAPTVSRCLATLVEAGYVTHLDNGRYALGVRVLAIGQAHANEMARASERINELQQRVMAASHH